MDPELMDENLIDRLHPPLTKTIPHYLDKLRINQSGPDATKLFLCWANLFCSNLCSQPIKFENFLIWEYYQT